MTPEQRIDAALDAVLRAAGSGLRHYSCATTLERMREVMRAALLQAYIDGALAERKARKAARGGARDA